MVLNLILDYQIMLFDLIQGWMQAKIEMTAGVKHAAKQNYIFGGFSCYAVPIL